MNFETSENSEGVGDYLDSKIGKFNKDSSVFTIYIGNLPYEFAETDILDLFRSYGFVNYVKLIKDNKTYLSKGIAFVQMPSQKAAKLAISNLNGQECSGRILKVNIADEADSGRVVVSKKRRKPYRAYISKKDRESQSEA